jgi:hypothetical protein
LSSITIDHAYPIGPQISHVCLPGLVFTYKKLSKITMFNGKIHYFYGHFQ